MSTPSWCWLLLFVTLLLANACAGRKPSFAILLAAFLLSGAVVTAALIAIKVVVWAWS